MHLLRSAAALALVASLTALASPSSAAPRPTCQGRPATIVGEKDIVGTNGDDVIVGSEEDDNIDAKRGDDLVCSLGGHDSIWDGPGRDRIYGGEQQDGLWQTSVDRDFFDGGQNFDVVIYEYFSVEPVYVNLRDSKANDGHDGEHDRYLSVAGVAAGSGDDVIVSGNQTNSENGGFPVGDYQLFGGPGDDVIIGGPRSDMIAGGPGHDVLKGRGGRDYLDSSEVGYDAAPEPDRVDGGRGRHRDYAFCDELDVVTRVWRHEGC